VKLRGRDRKFESLERGKQHLLSEGLDCKKIAERIRRPKRAQDGIILQRFQRESDELFVVEGSIKTFGGNRGLEKEDDRRGALVTPKGQRIQEKESSTRLARLRPIRKGIQA